MLILLAYTPHRGELLCSLFRRKLRRSFQNACPLSTACCSLQKNTARVGFRRPYAITPYRPLVSPLPRAVCITPVCLSLPLLLLLLLLCAVTWPEQSTPHDLFPCPGPRPRLVGLDSLGVGGVRLAFG